MKQVEEIIKTRIFDTIDEEMDSYRNMWNGAWFKIVDSPGRSISDLFFELNNHVIDEITQRIAHRAIRGWNIVLR